MSICKFINLQLGSVLNLSSELDSGSKSPSRNVTDFVIVGRLMLLVSKSDQV